MADSNPQAEYLDNYIKNQEEKLRREDEEVKDAQEELRDLKMKRGVTAALLDSLREIRANMPAPLNGVGAGSGGTKEIEKREAHLKQASEIGAAAQERIYLKNLMEAGRFLTHAEQREDFLARGIDISTHDVNLTSRRLRRRGEVGKISYGTASQHSAYGLYAFVSGNRADGFVLEDSKHEPSFATDTSAPPEITWDAEPQTPNLFHQEA